MSSENNEKHTPRGLREIIASLPVIKDEQSFYHLPDLGSPRNRGLWEDAGNTLQRNAESAPDDRSIYALMAARDIFAALGDIGRAIQAHPAPTPGSRASAPTDLLLSLKWHHGDPVDGRDVATLFGPKLTRFGLEHIELVMEYLDIQLRQIQMHDRPDLLGEWAADARPHPHGMPLFSGHPLHILIKDFPYLSFSLSDLALQDCKSLLRDAENTLREERDIPRVGEGWVAETNLFYEIRNAFPDHQVIQHGRPEWLGRQHLDVYLPELNVALEYQGEQHDRPVAYFGGEEAFRKNLERDRRKLAKCRRHGVKIIYVRKGYLLEDLVCGIKSSGL